MPKKTQKFGKYLTDNPAYTYVHIKEVKKEHGRPKSNIRWLMWNLKLEAYRTYHNNQQYYLNEL